MSEVEAAFTAWDQHQADHGCATLTCALAKARWLLWLAALREVAPAKPAEQGSLNPRGHVR